MKHENEIPEYDNMTEEQKRRLLLNLATLMHSVSYLLKRECENASDDIDTTEDVAAANNLMAASLVTDTIMRDHGGIEECEEVLDENFGGAMKAFNWIMDDEFPICKAID